MHPMPMMIDAANEKIVRRDMITILPRLPKKRIPPAPRDLEQIAQESCNLPPQHCALRHGFVDLDQPRHLGTARIGTIHLTCRRVSKGRVSARAGALRVKLLGSLREQSGRSEGDRSLSGARAKRTFGNAHCTHQRRRNSRRTRKADCRRVTDCCNARRRSRATIVKTAV
jgi:hypothetical protein